MFVLLCQSYIAFSEVITVTSNADSGTGTLRDALNIAASNGIAERDYIRFNLPGITDADRSIQTNSPLPAVSSNLVIDGTTQTGAFYGVTHARVKVLCNNDFYTNQEPIIRGTGVDELEIYGLWLENLNDYPAANGAIVLQDCGKLVIGGLNKGNYFKRNGITIEKVKDFVFQGNVCFSNEFGTVGGNNAITLGGIEKVLIGGSEEEGNMIAGSLRIGGISGHPDYTKKEIEISYNNMGASYDKTYSDISFGIERCRIEISGSYNGGQPVYEENNILIKKNIITACNTTSGVLIANTSGIVVIQGNGFDTDLAGIMDYSGSKFRSGVGIALDTKARCLVGGESPGEANIIRSQTDGVYNTNRAEGSCKISRNRMYCLSGIPHLIGIGPINIPVVEITSSPSEPLQGTATPGATVELFYDDACTGCTPETYFGTVIADASGNWVYPGPVNGAVIASATLANQTSLFTDAVLKMDGLMVTNASCGLDNGAITGIQTSNSQVFKWKNQLGEIVGNTLNIQHLKPGSYTLTLGEGNCSKSTNVIVVRDGTPVFNDNNVSLTQPSCGLSNGNIENILVTTADFSNLKLEWYDQHNNLKATTPDLLNVSSGKYTLKAINTVLNCTSIYGPVTLMNTTGPNLDEINAIIVSTNCRSNTGSISNIITNGTGVLRYSWKNNTGQTVGTSRDLIGQPAGSYILEVSDESGCGSVYTSALTIPEINGITINLANQIVSNASCNGRRGSIKGIEVTGATSYQWLDADGNVVGTTLDLTGVLAGRYHLVAANVSCSKTSGEILIALAQSTRNYSNTEVLTPASCGLNNGKIEAIFTRDQPSACFWKNSLGQVVGHSKILENQGPGTYDLYAIDEHGCEHLLQQYSISNLPGVSINRNLEQVRNDQCGLGKGQIKAPGLNGGQLPYFYEWKDQDGRVVGSGAVLDQIKTGTYQLTIGDALACSKQVISYNLLNESNVVPVPVVNNVKICSAGQAGIQVMNAVEGVYTLYNENGSLIQRSDKGVFSLNVSQTQVYTVVLTKGTCESLASPVKVTIENDGIGTLANAFSPNGDGVNDQWVISGIASYPEATVAVFNRYGNKVFDSTGYKTPFNGRLNGTELPVGTYYYIIDLKRGCGLQKGSLFLIR